MRSFSLYPQAAALVASIAFLAACSSPPPRAGSTGVPPTASSKYYKDDGPGDSPPANLDAIADAMPRLEAVNRFASRPYTVLGRDYVPATSLRPYRERGIASWYGRKFHGQKTAIGETYDMYAMTAAHPTLPLPSYLRVTSVATGRSVVVRVNDRGPFLHGRIVDLSYAAAHRIGIAGRGSGEVEVESIIPGASPIMLAQAPLPPVGSTPAAASPSTGANVVTAPLRSADAPVSSSGAPVEVPANMPITAVAALPSERAPVIGAAGGFAVQLGAFQNYVNAQNFLAHIQGQLVVAQVEPKVREANGLYRVYVGPYADREEARRVADRITNALGVATAIAPH